MFLALFPVVPVKGYTLVGKELLFEMQIPDMLPTECLS
jgi:hypothetical protein